MDVMAKALVLAVQHIADRDGDEDQDMAMLERLAALLQNATPEERKSLVDTANLLGLQEWAEQLGL